MRPDDPALPAIGRPRAAPVGTAAEAVAPAPPVQASSEPRAAEPVERVVQLVPQPKPFGALIRKREPLPPGHFYDMQQAIADLEANGGGVLQLPPDRVKVPRGGVVVRKDVTLRGAPGRKTRLRGASGEALIRVEGGHAKLESLNLESWQVAAVQVTAGCELTASDCLLKSKEIRMPWLGILADGEGAVAKVTGSDFEGVGLLAKNSARAIIEQSRFKSSVETAVSGENSSLELETCSFESCRGFAVQVAGGSANLTNCEVVDCGDDAIVLQAATARLGCNRLRDGKGFGVQAFNGAVLEMPGNNVLSGNLGGVEVGGHTSRASISRNTFEGNGAGVGIKIHNEARAWVLENMISRHGWGVRAERRAGAELLVADNKLRENDIGVGVFDGLASVTGNEIASCAMHGIYVDGAGAGPSIEGNDIHSCRKSGVTFKNGAGGQLRRNQLHDNANGVQIEGAGTGPALRDNTIHHNWRRGVVFAHGSGGEVMHDDIAFNGIGVAVWDERTAPTVSHAAIHENQEQGVFVHEKSAPKLRQNRVFDNGAQGIVVETEARPLIKRNVARENECAGIEFRKGGGGVAAKNDIAGNLSGVEVSGTSTAPVVRSNRIRANLESGMIFTDGAKGRAEGNVITGHPLTSVVVEGPGTEPQITDNTIRDGQQPGILIHGSGGLVSENEISGHQGAGIVLVHPQFPLLVGNVLRDNEGPGVMAMGQPKALLVVNQILATAGKPVTGFELDPRARNATGGHGHLDREQILLLLEHGAFRRAVSQARVASILHPSRGDPDPWALLAAAAAAPAGHLPAKDLWWIAASEAKVAAASIKSTSPRGATLAGIVQAEHSLEAGDVTAALGHVPRDGSIRAKLAEFQGLLARGLPGDKDRAAELFPEGPGEAARAAAALWPGKGPLPHYLRSQVAEFSAQGDLNGFFAWAGEIKGKGLEQRRLIAALLEAFLDPGVGKPVLEHPTLTANATCGICMEPLRDEGARGAVIAEDVYGAREVEAAKTAFRMARCECEGNFCSGCVREHIEKTEASGTRDCCPQPGCGAPACRQDLEALGLRAGDVATRVARHLGQLLEKREAFVPCTTADCLGGLDVEGGQTRSVLTCPVCATPSVGGRIDFDRMTLEQLLEGLFPSNSPNGQGITRGCYECGVTTEKGNGCSLMFCSSCKGEYDFVNGPKGQAFMGHDGIGPQRFRPKGPDLLTKVGFWPADVPPGAVLDEAQLTSVHARAKAWLASLKKGELPSDIELGSAAPEVRGD